MLSKKNVRRFGPKWLAVTGALIAICAGAGIATAKIKTRSNSTTIAGDANGSVKAKCPRGSEAVSGGFASPGFDPTFTGRSIVDFASKRTGNRKWKTQGTNFSPAQSGKLISFAYCDTHQPGLRVRSESTLLSAFDPGSATAKCPRGSEAVSGGFKSPDASTDQDAPLSVTSKRVSHRKWKVSAYNNDPSNNQRLVTFAYCDKHEPGLKAESKQVTVPAADTRSLTANCVHGRKAFSGGYQAPVDTDANGAFAFTSKRVKGGDWKGVAVGNGDGGSFKVFAYCK